MIPAGLREPVRGILGLVLAAVLLTSGLLKLGNEYAFLDAIYDYRLTSVEGGVVLAAVLPWLEVGVACLLLAGLMVRASLIVALALFVVFLAVQTTAALRGLEVACACFGSDARVDAVSILRTAALGAMTGLMLWLARPSSVTASVHPGVLR